MADIALDGGVHLGAQILEPHRRIGGIRVAADQVDRLGITAVDLGLGLETVLVILVEQQLGQLQSQGVEVHCRRP